MLLTYPTLMKKTLAIAAFFPLAVSSWAQSGSPVWNLPFAAGSTVRVDLDSDNHTPLRRQIMFSEVPGGGGLQVAAPATGMIHIIPDLEIMGCGDSVQPLPGEKCPPYGMVVEHGNGYFTAYANLDSASVAAAGIVDGSTVVAGQLLGSARPAGAIGLRKLHFEVYLPTNPTAFVTATNQLVRNIVTVRGRTGTYKYDTHNSTPIFQIGTLQRAVVAGEVLTLGTSKAMAAGLEGLQVSLFPNPSQGLMSLEMALPTQATVDLTVRDLQGALVAQPLHDQVLAAGTHAVAVDLGHLAAGIYLYRLQVGAHAQQGKLIIAR